MTDTPQSNPPRLPEPQPRHIESAELLQGQREILIEHAGQVYRLLVTKNDKLILQK